MRKLLEIIGGQGRNRTADAGLFRAALYRLSYLASGGKRLRSIGTSVNRCQLASAPCDNQEKMFADELRVSASPRLSVENRDGKLDAGFTQRR